MATFPRGHNARDVLGRKVRIGTVTTAPTSTRITWMLTASDSITLRGIPAIGRGVAGAIPGTNPQAQT